MDDFIENKGSSTVRSSLVLGTGNARADIFSGSHNETPRQGRLVASKKISSGRLKPKQESDDNTNMGTVGLSFGSPTSGAGFDVTSTVNRIITNMQAIETPWKNQLTALQAQDTALTSIGTDLNSLSTTMQSLTDFEGVLAEKQGSSSDTSILQLSSASTSAVAGSHTVTVQSLATTSSYVSGTISESDTLSGSLTINGRTINIDSTNNTLTALASAINSGSYGVIANVVTDSSGSRLSLVSQTSGSSGSISVDSSSLNDSTTSSQLGFAQTQSGADAQLKVDGVSVTSASNTVSNAIQGVTFQLLSANPSESIQIEITNNNSDVESVLNTFVTNYNKVMQDLNAQEGNDSNGTPEPLFGNPTIATIQQSLQSALTFLQPANAVASTSTIGKSDTLSGSISISVGGGAQQEIDVPTSGDQTLSGLAAAINSANIGVTATVITSGNRVTLSLTSATSGSAGAITVDGSGLTDVTSGGAVTFGTSQSNSVTSITQLGISVNNDGTLTLNTDALDSILNSNYQDVVNFFQPSGGFTSFGGNFSTVINNLGSTSTSGAIQLALQENSSTESQLNTNISNEEATISAQKTQLTTELNQANFILSQIPQQIQQINEIYSAITGYNQNNG